MKRTILSLLLVLCLSFSVGMTALGSADGRGFSDVPEGAFYDQAVAYVQEHGLMNGTSRTTFSPNSITSRGMLVTVLYRQAGQPAAPRADFTDVDDDAFYAAAVGWAASKGLVTGYGDGRFAPNDPVTRGQLAVILWRAAGSPLAGDTEGVADEEKGTGGNDPSFEPTPTPAPAPTLPPHLLLPPSQHPLPRKMTML